MKYSILYLNWDPEHKLCDTIKESLHSVISNSIGHDYELLIMDRKGVRKEINRGFKIARGEYIIILSNDVTIKSNWLDVLAVPNCISGWLKTKGSWIPDQFTDELDCSLVCIPRSVQDKVGDWDENFEGGYGYDDNDYLYRARQLGIELVEVPIKLEHKTSATFDAYNMKDERGMGKNHDYILKKHKLGNYRI